MAHLGLTMAGISRRLTTTLLAAMTMATIGSVGFGGVPASATAPALTLPKGEGIVDSVRSWRPGPRPAGAPTLLSPAGGGGQGRQLSSPRTAPPCNSQFNLVAGSNPGTAASFTLNNAMAAVSATDIWAAGGYANVNGPDQTLAERWDGSNWNVIPSPNLGFGNTDFWGLTIVPGAAADANNVWAVGDYTDASLVEHAMALQYTGAGWTQNLPANVGTGNNIFRAASAVASNNIWAVGSWRQDNTAGTPYQPLIGHWDGAMFTSVTGPRVSGTTSDRLFAVSARAANDVWAAGRSVDTAGNWSTLIEHYDGTTWSIITSANPGPKYNTLYGVTALSSSLAYAVGNYQDAGGRSHTLFEQWNGTNWSTVATPDVSGGVSDNFLFSVSATSASDVWTGGSVNAPNPNLSPADTVVEHWDGSQWKIIPSVDGESGQFNEINAILALSPTNVWVNGDYFNTAAGQDQTLFENLCIPRPTVTGVAPISGNSTGGTSVAISGSDFNFASAVMFGSTAATNFAVTSNNQITATAPAGAAGTVDVTVTNPAGTSATSPADTYVYVPPAISWLQYTLNGSDGATWQPIDAANLSVTFTPSVASNAVLSGNADLWTTIAGVNQDIGILVTGGTYGNTGQVVGWKESGGYAGTYSPNAAFVQTVIPVAAATSYTATLVWKTNKPTSGVIVVAAGNGLPFSPTRLTAELVPLTNLNLQTAASNSQYVMNGNDGNTWKDMDATNLVISNFTPAATGPALISGNADLWTTKAGVNQDIGILVSGGAFGGGQIVGWKESGGFAGTYSPNAAYVQTVAQLVAGQTYTIKLEWKTNIATTATIVAAAGSGPQFSPTRLTMHLYPAGTGLNDAASTKQYFRAGSTGSDWTPIDSTNLKTTVTPTANSLWILSGNADLWTANAGVNQDVAIFISGGAFGSGTLVAWKESGGFAGTFSPNAAFVQTVIPLASGTTYTVTLEWKANKATSGTIYIGAGPWPSGSLTYSPTRVTAQLMG